MYQKISDYGVIGNMHSLALVSDTGSIDYCCMPHIDSPTIFAALLDDEKGGYFKIQPDHSFESFQYYIENTNLLCCEFITASGRNRLIDFMHTDIDKERRHNDHVMHRLVEHCEGRSVYKLEFYPRPNYAQDAFVKRYVTADDFSSDEGCFVVCSFWLIECLVELGRLKEAKEFMQTVLKAANHLGLFSEEYDPDKNLMLGTFPQAYSHIGFINTAKAISLATQKAEKDDDEKPIQIRHR